MTPIETGMERTTESHTWYPKKKPLSWLNRKFDGKLTVIGQASLLPEMYSNWLKKAEA